eukprot:3804239-Pleurochrysis_carterae.AAC.1
MNAKRRRSVFGCAVPDCSHGPFIIVHGFRRRSSRPSLWMLEALRKPALAEMARNEERDMCKVDVFSILACPVALRTCQLRARGWDSRTAAAPLRFARHASSWLRYILR